MITVTKIELFEKETEVFDLTVEHDNSFIVHGVVLHNSTLDSRTTEQCLALHGKQWSLPDLEPIDHDLEFPGEIAHWGCRSTQVAVTKSFAELAAMDAPNKQMPALEGQVAAWYAEHGIDGGPVDLPSGKVALKDFIDHTPGLPMETLKSFMGPDGVVVLTAERQALHDAIVADAFKNATIVPKEDRVAIMLMGGTASGKSSIVSELIGGNWVRVDADLIKEMLPEFRQGIRAFAHDAANMVHEESSIIAERIRQQAMNQGYNVIFDTVGANAKKFGMTVSQLKGHEYRVHMMLASVDIETAVTRATLRALQSGRFVREDIMRLLHSQIPGSFAQNRALVDNFLMFDNSGLEPRLVWAMLDGIEELHDANYVQAFGFR